MAKCVEKLRKEAIHDFIVGNCQLLPKFYDSVSDPIFFGNERAIYCGSSAEFYILPLNSCIHDTDALILVGNVLALADDYPVLPSDVSRLDDKIKCYRMEPCHGYPGFVLLRHWGKMNYNWKNKKYEYIYAAKNKYVNVSIVGIADNYLRSTDEKQYYRTTRGPAMTIQTSKESKDYIKSLWCPQWPKEAHGWPKRIRCNGWPTIATIFEVVQQGCHVVHAQHRACRDERLQWRLSFSVSEVILLQSWTKIQQIVYHLLRFFAKRELIQKNCTKEDEVLCPYHLKTLMLWKCEKMSS